MKIELIPGIELNFIKNDQFKSVQILVSFVKKLTTQKELALRTLLASMLESGSQHFPSQRALTLKLAKLYGATFGVTAEVEGNLSLLNFVYSFVDPQYLMGKPSLLAESIAFLREMIFDSNIQNGLFDKETFERQKENLNLYIKGINDNKQSEALIGIQHLYFENKVQQHTPYGTAQDIMVITNQELTRSYWEMIRNDNVQITVMGNLDENELVRYLKQLPFSERPTYDFHDQVCYSQLLMPFKCQTKVENLQQSKLDLIYQLPISAHCGENFFAAVVMNALLGGSSQSRLFKIVREQQSLAYYADSCYSVLRSVVLIQTGIEASNKDKVVSLIKQQVSDIQKGKFDVEELYHLKKELINERKRMQDNPMSILDQQILGNILHEDLSYETQRNAVAAVTKEDVIAVANKLHLQAEYFLKGEEK